jgi:CDP-6-deoxy-D-xylo-4-hexulose-3-dehydrase
MGREGGKEEGVAIKTEWVSRRYGQKIGDLPEAYEHICAKSNVGYTFQATDVQAAIGQSQLNEVDRFDSSRRAKWAKLHAAITASPRLSDRLIPAAAAPGTNPSWFGFQLHCAPCVDRDRLVQFFEEKKVVTGLGASLIKRPASRGVEYSVHATLEATDCMM